MIRNDVSHAKTGSIVSNSAVWVGGNTDCAQLWMEKAAAVARTAAMASHDCEPRCPGDMRMLDERQAEAMKTAQKPT